jgi:hypothetical protein
MVYEREVAARVFARIDIAWKFEYKNIARQRYGFLQKTL